MRKIIFSMQMSLDGYIEDANGSISFTNPDDELHSYFNDRERENDTHIYGRRLYETMNDFWPTAEQNPDAGRVTVEYALLWNALDKIVFSRTLTHVEGRARLARDIESEVRELKSKPGKNISLGGAELAREFIERDLVDEYHVVIYPILLGAGKRMFGEFAEKLDLVLIETRTFASGAVLLKYARHSDTK
ncbi:dihydrofolate reductase family protein [Exiguobacterium flavidum]|uniref:dihydrofolate reductase family protein n=1 Tax=Exiguobacterium flavidum TaxID=2184695 RepID=UPI000DF85036|nr:dihydrofolate reductase family protein [Exiguobacterium flavidum]